MTNVQNRFNLVDRGSEAVLDHCGRQGTGKVAHLEDNVAGAAVNLSDEDFETLDALGRKASG